MTSADTSKPSTAITKVVRFRTPDGLRFTTYQEAQKHWSREQLIAYLKAHDWRNVEELADRLRKDWRVSKRGTVPVLDSVEYVESKDLQRVYDHVFNSASGAI